MRNQIELNNVPNEHQQYVHSLQVPRTHLQTYPKPNNQPNNQQTNQSHYIQSAQAEARQVPESQQPPSVRVYSWWLFILIIVVLIGIVSTGIYLYFLQRATKMQFEFFNALKLMDVGFENQCLPGYFPYQGKCVSCPQDTVWNGVQCKRIGQNGIKNQEIKYLNEINNPTSRGTISGLYSSPIVAKRFEPSELKQFVSNLNSKLTPFQPKPIT